MNTSPRSERDALERVIETAPAIIDFYDMLRAGILDYTPCDSPIEDIFYQDIQKRVRQDAIVRRQVECATNIGTFYLDFLVEYGARKVAFECDGKDFHSPGRDSARDRAIVDAGHADCIFRIRGRDICYRLHDALDLIAKAEPELFSERGKSNITALCAREGERRDDTGKCFQGFSFVAIRSYERNRDPELDYDDEDEPIPRLPTVVYWTK